MASLVRSAPKLLVTRVACRRRGGVVAVLVGASSVPSATMSIDYLCCSFQSIRLLSTEQPLANLLDEAEDETPKEFAEMSNEELADTTTIPGWGFIHTPPGGIPRGALVGKVVSDKMDKTVNVAVERYRIVPKYRKRLRYTRKFMAHDEDEVAKMGDVVMITPCHRISKHKHFKLREIVRAKGQLY